MPVDYSRSTTCGSWLYCITLSLAGRQRQLQAPVSHMSAAGASVSITHRSPEIMSATIVWDYALFKLENAVPSGNSAMSQRFAEESTFANTRAKSGMLLLTYNKIPLPLFWHSSWLSHSHSCTGLWKEMLGMDFFSCIFLSSQIYDPRFFPFTMW